MNAYNYQWLVVVRGGYFMAGIHRFKTCKAAAVFIEEWRAAYRSDATIPKNAISDKPYRSPENSWVHSSDA